MTLKQKIQTELKKALKAKQKIKISTLRLLLSEITNQEIAQKKKEKGLNDPAVIQVIQQQIKKHQDSIKEYKRGKRNDLADQEKKELKILQKYAPPLAEDKIVKIVRQALDQGLTEFGPLMGQVMQKLKGSADGNVVKKIVEKELKKI